MTDRNDILMRWMNKSFDIFINGEKLSTLLELKSPDLVYKILLEIDNDFFIDTEMKVDNSPKGIQFNMMSIYKSIKNYYSKQNIELEDNFFDIKESVSEDNHDENVELLTGTTTFCPNHDQYIEIMKTFDEEDQAELYKILTERITAQEETEIVRKVDVDSEDEESNTHLYIRIDNLSAEVNKLKQENEDLNYKNTDMVKENYSLEIALKDLKKEYDYYLLQAEQNKDLTKNQLNSDSETNFALKLKCNELKGKLDSKEDSMKKLLIEKENTENEYKKKVLGLQADLELYKEKSIKFDILNDKYERQLQGEDNKKMKQQLAILEKTIKDQETIINKIKNDNEKSKLFSKIEELNYVLMNEKESNAKLVRENELYKDRIVHLEKDNLFKDLELEDYKNNEYDKELEGKHVQPKEASLAEVVDDHDKKRLLELETQVKVLNDGYHKMSVENNRLKEENNKINVENCNLSSEIENLKQQSDKYKQYKVENKDYLSKLTEQINTLNQNKIEIDNLKLMKEKEAMDIENKYNKIIYQTNLSHNEALVKLKEQVSKLQGDNDHLKKELKNNEELLETKQLLINEIKNRNNQTQKDSKQLEYELKIKELTHTENLDLKHKLKDKESLVKTLEKQIGDLNEKMKTMETKSKNNFSAEDLSRKDETLKLYKSNFEQREKEFIEEQRMLASLIHDLGLNNLINGKYKPNGKESKN